MQPGLPHSYANPLHVAQGPSVEQPSRPRRLAPPPYALEPLVLRWTPRSRSEPAGTARAESVKPGPGAPDDELRPVRPPALDEHSRASVKPGGGLRVEPRVVRTASHLPSRPPHETSHMLSLLSQQPHLSRRMRRKQLFESSHASHLASHRASHLVGLRHSSHVPDTMRPEPRGPETFAGPWPHRRCLPPVPPSGQPARWYPSNDRSVGQLRAGSIDAPSTQYRLLVGPPHRGRPVGV